MSVAVCITDCRLSGVDAGEVGEKSETPVYNRSRRGNSVSPLAQRIVRIEQPLIMRGPNTMCL